MYLVPLIRSADERIDHDGQDEEVILKDIEENEREEIIIRGDNSYQVEDAVTFSAGYEANLDERDELIPWEFDDQ